MLREELSTNVVIVTSFRIMFRHVFALLREQYKASSLLEMLLIPSRDRISELPHRYELLNDIVEMAFMFRLCPTEFKSNYQLQRHLTNVHCKNREHACETCLKMFASRTNLTHHQQTHKQCEQVYGCVLCDKVFLYKDGLIQHAYSHDNDKPLQVVPEKVKEVVAYVLATMMEWVAYESLTQLCDDYHYGLNCYGENCCFDLAMVKEPTLSIEVSCTSWCHSWKGQIKTYDCFDVRV
ncbi:hypothetical protein HOLleu_32344 [Holothuria leucospilota]|uniref:C2H2-type domain-containing protein n=1 Tax=Holothuria leucospilota TaxID=206669 RepID=A0A9Q0YRI6_HOLLE|nr:hypothetical protein HOLleu_32344 [Holothuria leucospilota]